MTDFANKNTMVDETEKRGKKWKIENTKSKKWKGNFKHQMIFQSMKTSEGKMQLKGIEG
jgi:hypothetical protein